METVARSEFGYFLKSPSLETNPAPSAASKKRQLQEYTDRNSRE